MALERETNKINYKMGEILNMKQNNRKYPYAHGYNFGSNDKQVNYVEVNTKEKFYYGIGKDKETGKELVLDYIGKTRSEAHAFLDTEFNAMGAELTYLGAYN